MIDITVLVWLALTFGISALCRRKPTGNYYLNQ